jgi:hypothetical protein
MAVTPDHLQLRVCSVWDESFFADFARFGNEIAAEHPDGRYKIPETTNSFAQLLEPSREFAKNHFFEAYLLQDFSDSHSPKTIARLLVTLRTHEVRGETVCAGFFECRDHSEAASLLFEQARRFARIHGVSRVRTPIHGSFFHSYRHFHSRIDTEEAPFFGEPISQPYYTRLYQESGFYEVGKWHTAKISRAQSTQQFSSIFKRFFRSKAAPIKGIGKGHQLDSKAGALRVRKVDLSQWKRELSTLHSLLSESYSKMPDYEPIPLAEFQEAYEGFRHLLTPHLVFFLETQADQTPIGFVVSFMDPLPTLLAWERAQRLPSPLRTLASIWIFLRLKFPFFRRMLVVYIGKVERPELDVKGVTGLLGWQLTLNSLRYFSRNALICYLAENSPTYRSLPAGLKRVAEYTLYETKVTLTKD